MKGGIVSVVLLLFIVGCSGPDRIGVLRQFGFEQEYLDGYQDGCYSRTQQGKVHGESYHQDIERMHYDESYNDGWEDGFRQCIAKR
ncbi:hypothetical protein [Thaumasiovibrio sp. DFM-14]|uniref:hypothetical protein n=1 Tax=Thaumasiovibrio sp. DFM-14 TaxID=3384792 RepID=UPI0039A15F45